MANLFSFISGKKTKESTPFNVTATDAFLHFRDPGEGIPTDEKRQRIIDKVNRSY